MCVVCVCACVGVRVLGCVCWGACAGVCVGVRVLGCVCWGVYWGVCIGVCVLGCVCWGVCTSVSLCPLLAIPTMTAFEGKGLHVVFSFSKRPAEPNQCTVTLTASNSTPHTMSDFLFQAAVPKVNVTCM